MLAGWVGAAYLRRRRRWQAPLFPPKEPAPKKVSVHLRVDQDVLDWFRAQGKGHLTRMNAVLRAYFESQRHDKR